MKFDPLKDGKSSVQLLAHMGDDLMVVNAARVSMAKESQYVMGMDQGEHAPSPRLSEGDTKLIRYLALHNHWTPFSHPQVQLRIKMPIFIARQWFKHMVGFTRNETSRRYVSESPEVYLPDEWRKKAANVKQGSSDELVDAHDLAYPMAVGNAVHAYHHLLDLGVCPEQARMVLPQSMYTEFIETGSLAAYARLAGLRLDPHAQKEVRLYAEAVDDILSRLFPVSWYFLRGRNDEEVVPASAPFAGSPATGCLPRQVRGCPRVGCPESGHGDAENDPASGHHDPSASSPNQHTEGRVPVNRMAGVAPLHGDVQFLFGFG